MNKTPSTQEILQHAVQEAKEKLQEIKKSNKTLRRKSQEVIPILMLLAKSLRKVRGEALPCDEETRVKLGFCVGECPCRSYIYAWRSITSAAGAAHNHELMGRGFILKAQWATSTTSSLLESIEEKSRKITA